MIIELFVLGTTAFWVLLGVLILLGFVCAAWEDLPALTIFVVIISTLLLVLAGDLGNYVLQNPWCLGWIPAWLGIGLVWSLPRWLLFLRKGKRYFDNLIKDVDLIDIQARRRFRDSLDFYEGKEQYAFNYTPDTGTVIPPQANEQIGRIATWVLVWPWSIIWTLTGDGLVEVTRWIVERLSILYQRIANYIYQD